MTIAIAGLMRPGSWRRWALGSVFSLVAILLLWRVGGGFEQPIAIPFRHPYFWLGLCFYLASQVLLARRWLRILRACLPDLRIHWATMLRLTLLHNAAQNLLPARTGEVVFPFLAQRTWGVDLARASGVLVAGRALDCVTLPLVVGGALLVGGGGILQSVGIRFSLLGLILLALLVVALLLVVRSGSVPERSQESSAGWRAYWGQRLSRVLRATRSLPRRGLVAAGAETTAAFGLRMLSLSLLLMALLPELGAARALGVTAGFLMLAAIPVGGPGGAGTFELAWVLPLAALGVAAGRATAVALSAHAVFLAAAIVLGLIAWSWPRLVRRPLAWALPAVVGLALGLRLTGIDYGLPHLFHADEALEVFRALRLGTGEIDLDLSRALKGGLFYLLFIEYSLVTVFGLLLGKLQSPADLGHLVAADPSLVWLVGRATVAALGSATVVWLWRWERKSTRGILAALLLTFSFIHVRESQLIGLEVPLAFLAIVLLAQLRKIPGDETGRRGIWFSGALLGIAMMTKITGAALVFPFLLAFAWRPRGRRLKPLLQAGTLAALVYGVGNPGIWVNAAEILRFFTGSFTGVEAPELFTAAMLGGRRGPVFYFEALRLAFGWVGAAAALGGALWVATHFRRNADALLLAFLLPYLTVICSSQTVAVHRYIVPALPALALLAALPLAALWKHKRKPVVALTLSTLVILPPALESLRWNLEVRGDDTRLRALRWIEARLPGRSHILLEGNRTFPAAQTAPLPISAEHLAQQIDHYAARDSGKARYLSEYALPAARAREGKSFYPHYIDPFDPAPSLDEHRAAGVQWAILTSRIADNYASEDAWQQAPGVASLYQRIWSSGEVVAEFKPQPWRCAGPVITVLRFEEPGVVAVQQWGRGS